MKILCKIHGIVESYRDQCPVCCQEKNREIIERIEKIGKEIEELIELLELAREYVWEKRQADQTLGKYIKAREEEITDGNANVSSKFNV